MLDEVRPETAWKVRVLRKRLNLLRAEQRRMIHSIIDSYGSTAEIWRIKRAIGTRATLLFRILGIDFRTFYEAMLYYEFVERERTGEWYTSSTWLMFWARGHVGICGY